MYGSPGVFGLLAGVSCHVAGLPAELLGGGAGWRGASLYEGGGRGDAPNGLEFGAGLRPNIGMIDLFH